MHPGTKEAPLAHHIIAQSYFDDLKTANRDQTPARKALEQLKILKARYPDSEYARDADNKIRICNDNLAAQEMEIGRYYLDKHNYVGAINRVGTEAPWNIGEFYGQSYFCNPRGKIIAEASRDRDEVLVADLDLDMIQEVRNVWQFYRDRRPETYVRAGEV